MFDLSPKVVPNNEFPYPTIKFYPQQENVIPYNKFFNTQPCFLLFWGLLERAEHQYNTLAGRACTYSHYYLMYMPLQEQDTLIFQIKSNGMVSK